MSLCDEAYDVLMSAGGELFLYTMIVIDLLTFTVLFSSNTFSPITILSCVLSCPVCVCSVYAPSCKVTLHSKGVKSSPILTLHVADYPAFKPQSLTRSSDLRV